MMAKIMICLSGGLDSSCLTHLLKAEGNDVCGLFIDRGQGNLEPEAAASRYVAQELQIELRETSLRDWRQSWPLGIEDFVVPRNAIFVLAALPFARAAEVDEIALGCNRDDTAVPDGHPEFVVALNGLLKATRQDERAVAPFLDREMTKTDICEYALSRIGDEFVRQTWSCYRSDPLPCGKCRACETRAHAERVARERLTSRQTSGTT